jgi:hypothetical protein
MKRFWQIITLILLALMVPASVCCLMPAKDFKVCACQGAHAEHDEAPVLPDVCPTDTIAHSQVPLLVAVPAMQMLELADIIHAMMRLNELVATAAAPVPLMTTAPPELRATWHFVSRAALPARAPSIQA